MMNVYVMHWVYDWECATTIIIHAFSRDSAKRILWATLSRGSGPWYVNSDDIKGVADRLVDRAICVSQVNVDEQEIQFI